MALTPFDMEGVNRDLLAAGNPAKPDIQSILRSADAIALDIDPHYLAAAFTGKTVSLCDQLEQATKQTTAEIEEMRLQEPSVESSDGNDDSTAFFQDFLEGKKIVGLSM